jgi:hypothetical protein
MPLAGYPVHIWTGDSGVRSNRIYRVSAVSSLHVATWEDQEALEEQMATFLCLASCTTRLTLIGLAWIDLGGSVASRDCSKPQLLGGLWPSFRLGNMEICCECQGTLLATLYWSGRSLASPLPPPGSPAWYSCIQGPLLQHSSQLVTSIQSLIKQNSCRVCSENRKCWFSLRPLEEVQ